MSEKKETKMQSAEQTPEQTPERTAPKKGAGEKLVQVHLFKDNERYKDDVFVAVNGRSFQIKRGETVTVPDYVAEVLEHQNRQDQATARLIERESSSYEAEARARNLL